MLMNFRKFNQQMPCDYIDKAHLNNNVTLGNILHRGNKLQVLKVGDLHIVQWFSHRVLAANLFHHHRKIP